jgi:hypothetical protein
MPHCDFDLLIRFYRIPRGHRPLRRCTGADRLNQAGTQDESRNAESMLRHVEENTGVSDYRYTRQQRECAANPPCLLEICEETWYRRSSGVLTPANLLSLAIHWYPPQKSDQVKHHGGTRGPGPSSESSSTHHLCYSLQRYYHTWSDSEDHSSIWALRPVCLPTSLLESASLHCQVFKSSSTHYYYYTRPKDPNYSSPSNLGVLLNG